jgi:hypothetical protein
MHILNIRQNQQKEIREYFEFKKIITNYIICFGLCGFIEILNIYAITAVDEYGALFEFN